MKNFLHVVAASSLFFNIHCLITPYLCIYLCIQVTVDVDVCQTLKKYKCIVVIIIISIY